MNKKKTIIAVVLILALVLGLAFCGKKEVAPEQDLTTAVQSAEANQNNEKTVAVGTNETTADSLENVATEVPATEETEATKVPEETKSELEQFFEENTSIGVAPGGATNDIDEGGSNTPPQVITPPAEEDTSDEPVELTVAISDITYDMYLAMSAGEQEAVIKSFGSMDDFMVWLNYIKAQYEADHPNIEIGPGGSVDLG